uniref:Uncharacterized protein n=1 Tax=Chromera velia CCMP2878 TaxID=1169474 RepID=A0A0G4I1S5_9ALVE|eukprot:Cvel_1679.t1-p1 / transcript=Cvel_1679.t1 / gene=Cvel_1679 / organism=Chromera_velia_CCMP2878 / gene_product=hypothetical protein / transcript_product=hypothetical protein / location=Cvel_scaffold60:89082-90238(-) / protein_length=165 / sequence_SO=supercontig / SO=protein_coding / is_pseudo=false
MQGPELFELHTDLRRGATLDEAIREKLADMRGYLSTQLVVQKGPDFNEMTEKNDTLTVQAVKSALKKRRVSLLHLLRKHNWSLPLGVAENKELQDSVDYLCEANVLWQRQDPNVVVPVHSTNGMRNALIRHLDENPEVESPGDDGLDGARIRRPPGFSGARPTTD